MPAELMDFRCFVGTYEIKSIDELPAKARAYEEKHPAANMDHDGSKMDRLFAGADIARLFLVQVGPAKAVPAKRKALEYAVGLLLQTETDLGAAETISKLKRNVLLISKSIGMLETDDEARVGLREDLSSWIRTARSIQGLFELQDVKKKGAFYEHTPEEMEVDVGLLKILISYHPDHPSIQLRPDTMRSALLYCAAQMLNRGMTAHACDNCSTVFLGGGERGRNKKRAGSRFCSDGCRYEFHNRQKAKANPNPNRRRQWRK
jgi:hypothetical protein